MNSGSEKARVVRPSVSRWLRAIGQNKNVQQGGAQQTAEVVQLLPSTAGTTRTVGAADYGNSANEERVRELRLRVTELEVAIGEWTVRSENLQIKVNRARGRRAGAVRRLSSAEPVAGTSRLSVLEDSYRNSTRSFELQQKKLERATRKLARLQSSHSGLCAEVLARTQNPGDIDQDFRHAA